MGKLIAASLTLVRHGETVANRENIIQGQIDTCLSETGHQQALMVGSRLQNERWTHVFASDLNRAAQTAQVIVEANKFNKSSVVCDKRLRERKYGVMEGKTFRELTAAAKSKDVTITNYTPCGAEHIEEVRKRAKSFFQDLLNLLKNNAVEEVSYTPASIKSRVNQGLNNSVNPNIDSSHTDKQSANTDLSLTCHSANTNSASSSTCHTDRNSANIKIDSSLPCHHDKNSVSPIVDLSLACPSKNSANCNTDLSPACHSDQNSNLANKNCLTDTPNKIESTSKRPRHENSQPVNQANSEVLQASCSKQSASKSKKTGNIPPWSNDSQNSQNERGATVRRTDWGSNAQRTNDNFEDESGRKVVNSSYVKSAEFGCPNISVSSLSSDGDPSQVHFYTDNANPTEIVSQRPSSMYTKFKDSEIKTIIKPTKNANPDCPNVSLSPLLEHRLPSVSSISSGRNSSFDDTEGAPLFIAEVLVVSHGGLIKELIRHILEDYKCRMPGGKGHALRVGPNASLSKFTITIDEVSDLPIITCLRLHDKDHLLSMNIEDAQGTL